MTFARAVVAMVLGTGSGLATAQQLQVLIDAVCLPSNLGATASVAALCLGAVVALAHRLRPESDNYEPRGFRRLFAASARGRDPAKGPTLQWRPAYESGVETIDAQHRQILDRGNVIIRAAFETRSHAELERLFESLIDEVAEHMAHEERLLEEARSPSLPQHHRLHDAILLRAAELRGQLRRRGTLPADTLIDFVVREFVVDHVVTVDLPAFAALPAAE